MLKILRRLFGWDEPDDEPVSPPSFAAPDRPAAHKAAPGQPVPPDPKLTLNPPEQTGFDPYNTGAFDRSASWDKISKKRKS